MKPSIPPVLITFALVCSALVQNTQAVSPPPDGGYSGANTAEGTNALFSLTTGVWNTALGYRALFHDTTGNQNTATGYQALFSNTTGDHSVATGAQTLFNNTTGSFNTATGFRALFGNTTGSSNTANGFEALGVNTTGNNNTTIGYLALLYSGDDNTAIGFGAGRGGNAITAVGSRALPNNAADGNTAIGCQALFRNSTGSNDMASGYQALFNNSTGSNNTANGVGALFNNFSGVQNTATGAGALQNNNTGSNNAAIGFGAGSNSTGDGNVYIGSGILGTVGDAFHTYIANINTTSVSGAGTDTVTVNLSTGLLGHLSSSRRYKEDIKPMDKASEVLFALKPVTYRYKKEIDATQSLDYGLIAEEVARIDPNLAARDGKGQVESVRYNAINAMLLNEFLKEHRKIEQQDAVITQLKSLVARQDAIAAEQQKEIGVLTVGLKEQARQFQKLSTQIETSKPTSHVALTDHN